VPRRRKTTRNRFVQAEPSSIQKVAKLLAVLLADSIGQGGWLGSEIFTISLPVRDRLLRDGVHVAIDVSVRYRPFRCAVAAV
jgi:hypothetical protein